MNNILKYICEDEYGNMPKSSTEYEEQIIVSMTSWTKRINNIKTVMISILENTILHAKIICNLAIEEFPNKEKDLPIDLVNFINSNELTEIHWVKNNTTIWKKSIPTLLRYPKSYILCIDDDWIYPNDIIETFKNKHSLLINNPLTGCICKVHDNINQHCGTASLDKLEWLMPWFNLINEEIFNSGSEDDFMTYCYKMANKEIKYVGKQFWINMKSFNSNDSYSKSFFSTHKVNPWEACKKQLIIENLIN